MGLGQKFAMLALLVLSVGCGNLAYLSNSSEDAAAVSARILKKYAGVYHGPCDTTSDPLMDEFSFTESGFYNYTARDYDSGDTTCSGNPISTLVYVFKPTFSESGTENVHQVDISLVKFYVIPSTTARTAALQSALDSMCPSHGVTLREGMINDLTGKCDAIAPQNQYDLVGLTEGTPNSIQIGDRTTLDGTTPDNRPTSLASYHFDKLTTDGLQAFRGAFAATMGGESCISIGGGNYLAGTLVLAGNQVFTNIAVFPESTCTSTALLRLAQTSILSEGTVGTYPSDAIRSDTVVVSSYMLSTDAGVTADQNAGKCGDTATTLVTNTLLNTSGGECGEAATGEALFGIIKNNPLAFNFGDDTVDAAYDGTTAMKRPQVYDTSTTWVPFQ